MQKLTAGPIIAILVVVYVLFNQQIKAALSDFKFPSLGGGGSANAEQFPGQPTNPTVVNAVAPVTAALKSAESGDKLALQRLWREYAKLIALSDGVVQTTADIRRGNGITGRLMFVDGTLKGRYPGLAQTVDAAIVAVLGNDAKALDVGTRQAAVEVFNGLSWAAGQ